MMKKKYSQTVEKIKNYIGMRYGGTDRAVYVLLLLTAFLLGSFSFLEIGIPKWIAFPVFGLLAVAATALAVRVGSWILRGCLYHGERHLITLGLLFGFICYFCMSARMDIVSEAQGMVTAVLVFLISILFVRSLYAMIHDKKRNRSIFVICLASGLLFGAVAVLIRSEGFEDTYVEEYVKLNRTEPLQGAAQLESQMKKGVYQVGVAEYGSELKRVKPSRKKNVDYLDSSVMDLSPFVDGYEGLDARYRELYLGYDIQNVPLAGRIWYPKEGKHCPVLFIIHGNHYFTTQSYLGYEYLGEYLASHGYVVVSVDENFCNGDIFGNLTEENDARAILLLENIGNVLRYNEEEKNPLYGKINEDQIAIAGHSRGGEAVAIAAYFNTLKNYPEDGMIDFHYHYPIKSVIAIAPSVDQYLPVDRSVELTDINYLLLQGANDQDISVFMGLKQYNNIFFTGEEDYFKSYLYIAGANHGQFNSRWGKYDRNYPFNEILNVENLLPKKQQQSILKIFTKKFLDVTLLGQDGQKDLFYQVQGYRDILPETVYIQGYMDSSYDVVCDFEEDLDLTTGTMEGALINAEHMAEWTEKLSRFSNSSYRTNKDDYAMALRWNNTYDSYVNIRISPYDGTDKKLSFDILDMDNADVKKEDYHILDCSIVLTDKHGNQAKTSLSHHCTIYPPLPVRLSKLQYLFGKNEYKHQFQTVLIPITELKGQDFDPSCITKISFCFDKDKSGTLRLDDIAFVR